MFSVNMYKPLADYMTLYPPFLTVAPATVRHITYNFCLLLLRDEAGKRTQHVKGFCLRRVQALPGPAFCLDRVG
jgi:hypothetical protein